MPPLPVDHCLKHCPERLPEERVESGAEKRIEAALNLQQGKERFVQGF
jgi:hypothetical protein